MESVLALAALGRVREWRFSAVLVREVRFGSERFEAGSSEVSARLCSGRRSFGLRLAFELEEAGVGGEGGRV